MIKQSLIRFTLILSFFVPIGSSFAVDQTPVYGGQLMTQQERIEHRERLRNAKTAKEREQIREKHHMRIQERAKARGVTLPNAPTADSKSKTPAGGSKGSGGGRGK